MPVIIPVKFQYAARDLWFDPAGSGAQEADHVICATDRGMEIGIVTADPREVSDEQLADAIGRSGLKRVDRVATEGDLRHAEKQAERGERAFPVFRGLVKESGLDMKPVGVEYLFGGEKVVCYFAAEERVDFRQLVRDLSHALHERIDMRQIGVREEAAIMGGYGHCGQELCCRRFGLQFEPVSIRMAKEQDLPLNSNKISGACGRLMCCLRYEFEAYRDFKGRAPKRNAVIDTPLGKAKIVEYDTPKEEICLRLESGKQVRVPLAEMVASDAAKHKSEELGCPCRPDTVPRSALERLNSPDVQMALAELDRKMGVLPAEEGYDEADLFVESRPRRHRDQGRGQGSQGRGQARRRRPSKEGSGESGTVGQGQAPGSASRSRRRRRKGSAEASQAAGGGERASSQRPRRRGQPTPAHGAQNGQATTEAQPKSTRRRRHHQSQAGAPQPSGAREASGARASQDSRQAQGQARRTRHPGDKGAQGQQAQPRQGQGRRRRHRGGGRGGSDAGSGATGGAPSGTA